MAATASARANPVAVSETAAEKATVAREMGDEEARWRPVLALPCELVVELPLPNFKVSDFLKLQAGSVIATEWRITRDVPLRANGTLIAWGEFDGSGNRLAVRLTELA
jgi:flagellar motor switch/type III secretory pathway protein FliN